MELLRTRSCKSHFRLGWLNAPGRGCSQLNQKSAKPRRQSRVTRTPDEVAPAVIDFLDVNADLTYTTVVEGLEEFLYQQESQKCA